MNHVLLAIILGIVVSACALLPVCLWCIKHRRNNEENASASLSFIVRETTEGDEHISKTIHISDQQLKQPPTSKTAEEYLSNATFATTQTPEPAMCCGHSMPVPTQNYKSPPREVVDGDHAMTAAQNSMQMCSDEAIDEFDVGGCTLSAATIEEMDNARLSATMTITMTDASLPIETLPKHMLTKTSDSLNPDFVVEAAYFSSMIKTPTIPVASAAHINLFLTSPSSGLSSAPYSPRYPSLHALSASQSTGSLRSAASGPSESQSSAVDLVAIPQRASDSVNVMTTVHGSACTMSSLPESHSMPIICANAGQSQSMSIITSMCTESDAK